MRHACARARFVLLLAEERDYFFVMYCVLFAAEGWLALLALAHYPAQEHMEPLPDDLFMLPLYEVRVPLGCGMQAFCWSSVSCGHGHHWLQTALAARAWGLLSALGRHAG